MESTIWRTGVRVFVIMETLGKRALVPMFSTTAKPVVRRNRTTSITDEHITRSTRNRRLTPMASVRGRSVGMRSLPSANMVEPNSCIWPWRAGSCASIRSRPCFMG